MSADVESAGNPSPEEDDVPDLNGEGASDDDGDLFGDDEDEPQNNLHRTLDDSELDSGDDQGRNDRVATTVEDGEGIYEEQKQLKLLDVDVARIKPPEGDELFLVNIPEFLGIKHRNFDYATYEPPAKPHDGSDGKFSAFSTANTSLFWRRDPQNPENIQSNARVIRWSDGSFTLQIASKPTEQYRISTTAMRPGWPRKTAHQEHYDPTKESNNYLGAPHQTIGMDLQIVAPFDASMKIQPTGDTADAAELKLRQSIAAKAQLNDIPSSFKSVKVDPELARKKAEQAEKEVARTARKREAAAERQFTRRDKVLGRSGLGRSTGLTIGGLEDDMPTARGVKAKPARRKSNRRGDILSDEDEDDEAYRRRGRQDEYDREDDFVADSDEEPEVYEDDAAEEPEAEEDDDPDNDDLEIEGRQTVVENRTRGGARDRERTPKRSRNDDDDDAEAEEDTEARRPAPRKLRRIVDDDSE
ncbi:hypothetical protein PV04_01171 [Phialophora macrospora]|uniref:Leo1-like protein n=1 Tax=Phialophora macrospora TaxID=1851006 RepID=A0A0D2D663_9EURO|nr:hypothetical protein PV04_01171 [Phialophora macrospora]